VKWRSQLLTSHYLQQSAKTVCEGLQKEFGKLSDWVIKWQMKFSVNKCKVMHMEENNLKYMFTVMDFK